MQSLYYLRGLLVTGKDTFLKEIGLSKPDRSDGTEFASSLSLSLSHERQQSDHVFDDFLNWKGEIRRIRKTNEDGPLDHKLSRNSVWQNSETTKPSLGFVGGSNAPLSYGHLGHWNQGSVFAAYKEWASLFFVYLGKPKFKPLIIQNSSTLFKLGIDSWHLGFGRCQSVDLT